MQNITTNHKGTEREHKSKHSWKLNRNVYGFSLYAKSVAFENNLSPIRAIASLSYTVVLYFKRYIDIKFTAKR